MDRKPEDVYADAERMAAYHRRLLKSAEDKLARETAEVERKRKLVQALPLALSIEPKALFGSGYKCDAGIKFMMTSRTQALALLAELPPVAVVLLRGGCTSFLPEQRFDGKLKERQTMEAVAPVTFRCEGYGGGYLREQFTWWTQMGEQLVHVHVELDMATSGGVVVRAQHVTRFERLVEVKWVFENVPEGRTIDWYGATERDPGGVTVYWPRETDLAKAMLSAARHTRRGTL